MSTSAQDPRHGAGDHQDDFPVPPNPVDELRGKIRMMEECLHRMSDATAIDLLSHKELSYLNQQLTHLGTFYVSACQIVTGVSICAQIAAEDVGTWDENEIVELTHPVKDVQAEGGAS